MYHLLQQYYLFQKFSRSERKILKIIMEATLLSEFGVSNQEIIEYAQVSKRTVISAIQKFREKRMIEDTGIGRITYHKLKKDVMQECFPQ